MKKFLFTCLIASFIILLNINFSIGQSTTLEGSVLYRGSDATHPMTSTTVNLIQNGSTLYSPAVGQYSPSLYTTTCNAGTYDLNVNCTLPWGGCNTTDAYLVQLYFTQQQSFDAFQIAIADCNGNGVVNATDALAIAARFVGQITVFPNGVPDWYYSQTVGSNPMVVIGNQANDCSWEAACYGDVDLSYAQGFKVEPTISLIASGIKEVKSGESFDLPITTLGNINVGAISIVLDFPVENYILTAVHFPKSSDKAKSMYNIVDGKLRIAWFNTDAIDLSAGDQLISLNLTPRNHKFINSGNAFGLDGSSEIANFQGNVIENVGLVIPKIELTGSYDNTVEINSYPNPANKSIEFNYSIPKDGNVSLVIYDILGHEVAQLINNLQLTDTYIKSYDVSNLPAGIYTYKFIFNDMLKTSKLVINR